MTTDLKEYKQLLTIELKDWTILTSDKTREELENFMQTAPDFITIDWVLFNKYQFKTAYERKVWSVEQFILSQPRDIQQKIRDRAAEKRAKAGTRFENIDQIQKFIDTL